MSGNGKLLDAECIMSALAVETTIQQVQRGIMNLQILAEAQYKTEWDAFEQPAAYEVTLDIFRRLDLWCKIDEACHKLLDSQLQGLTILLPQIRETGSKLKAGGK